MSGNPIDITGLTKRFGKVTALDGLDLQVPAGQVHGFLGPNGAGKSTTIRVLLGLLRIDSGRVRVLGGDPIDDAARVHRRLAYVPGDVSLWPNLTGGEAIDLLIRSRGGAPRASRRDELIERFDLDPRKKGRAYSKGNRQKVALIAALATPVELLLLDEPTSGLDPLMERVFADEVARAIGGGTTVLLSSHILSEVERLCDHVSIIKDGRIADSGTLAQLRHLRRTQVVAHLRTDPPVGLSTMPGVHHPSLSDGVWRAEVDDSALSEVVTGLGAAGLTGLVCNPPSLEELFLQHYSSGRA